MLIVSAAIGGSGRGGETLDTGTLDINNQDCIRRERTECTLEGVALEGVLSGTGCLAALN